MKIYLAARFGDKMQMRDVRTRLQDAGHEVTSQWIDVEHSDDKAHTVTDEDRVRFARMCIDDVLRADALVTFSCERKDSQIGGGRHVEFGVALSYDKIIVVVGPKGEHIFHYLPQVTMCDNIEAAMEYLS